MRLPRFFKAGSEHRTGEAAFAAREADAQDEADHVPAELPDATWAERARAVLPMGTSTGSKRREALWGATDADVRTHYLRANGDRKSTRLNSSHSQQSRMPSSA